MFSRRFMCINVKMRDLRVAGRLLHHLRVHNCAGVVTVSPVLLTVPRKIGLSGHEVLCRRIHTTSFYYNDRKKSDDKKDSDRNMNMFSGFAIWLTSVVISIGVYWIVNGDSIKPKRTDVSVKEFLEQLLPSGEVEEIYINPGFSSHSVFVRLRDGAVFQGNKSPSIIKVTGIKNTHEFENTIRLTEKKLGLRAMDGVSIVQNNVDPIDATAGFITVLITIGLIVFLLRRLNISSNIQKFDKQSSDMFSSMGMSSQAAGDKVSTGVKFSDVAGCAEAKQEVMEFVHYLKHPEKYQKLGAKMPKGCLLTGPPGVGKTLLAKAVATEAEVPFISKAGSDFVEIVGGLGARRVRDLFKKARSVAPCIVYIDELDAVGARRHQGESMGATGSSERDQTLNQILVEMDGILSSSDNVIVMSSTNRVDMLDKALLRPGRFDRHIAMDLPTKLERKAIFEQHLKSLKLTRPYSTYSDRLANLSPGMSGADIANICNEAAICAAREKSSSVDVQHFEQAFERVVVGSKRKTSAVSPEERRIIAFHEAGHALVGWLLKHTDALVKVSVVPRTKSTLGFTQTLPKEHKLYTRDQLMDFMSMRLAGRAAENLVFGTVTQGAEDDLKKVTDIAYSQVKHLGLSPEIGHISFAGQDESYSKPYSDAFAEKMDREVKNTVLEAHNRAHDILEKNRSKLDILAKELLSKEVLNYDDIVTLIGPPPHGNKAQVQDIDLGSFAPGAT